MESLPPDTDFTLNIIFKMQTYFLYEQHVHDKSSMVIKQCTVSFNKLINSKEKN